MCEVTKVFGGLKVAFYFGINFHLFVGNSHLTHMDPESQVISASEFLSKNIIGVGDFKPFGIYQFLDIGWDCTWILVNAR